MPSVIMKSTLLLALLYTFSTVLSQHTLDDTDLAAEIDKNTEDDEDREETCAGNDVMIIATHPDDEIVCCSGVISRAVKHGMCVQVVVLTNGEYFGSTAERGLERQKEAMEGLRHLGLNDPDSVIFLGYPENGLKTLYIDYNNKDDTFITNKK